MASPGCRRASSSTARCVTRAAGGTPRRVARTTRPSSGAAGCPTSSCATRREVCRGARGKYNGSTAAAARCRTSRRRTCASGPRRRRPPRCRTTRCWSARQRLRRRRRRCRRAREHLRPRRPRGSDPGRRGAARARAGARAESSRADPGALPPGRRGAEVHLHGAHRPAPRPGARARARSGAAAAAAVRPARDGTGTRRARRGRRRLAPEDALNGEDRAARSTQDPPGMQPLLASRGSRPMLSSAGGAHPSLRGCRVWVITTLPSHGRRTGEADRHRRYKQRRRPSGSW